jgi:hypothetical protein
VRQRRAAALRIESSNGWAEPPYDLTLVIILRPAVLPPFADDVLPERPTDLADWLYAEDDTLKVTSAQIAERLLADQSNEERVWLWDALGESWARRCRPRTDSSDAVLDGVSSISAEVVAADEYTLDRYRRSEQLELDHLSPPAPE